MTDTNPTLEGVTPEQVAELTQRLKGRSFFLRDVKLEVKSPELMGHAAAMLEALAADRDAQKARADAAERERAGWEELAKGNAEQAAKIGNDLIIRAEAAEAKVAKLVEAAKEVTRHDLFRYETRRAIDDLRAAIAEVQINRTTTPTEYERKVAQMKEDFPNGI